MKASEVIKEYEAGERNFQRVNLRGQSFKEQDLSGADFSKADIRSTNFTGANLRGTSFIGAECGLQKRWVKVLVIFSWLITVILGLALFMVVQLLLLLNSDFSINGTRISALISFFVLFIFFVLIIRKGIKGAAIALIGIGAIAGAISGSISIPGMGSLNGTLIGAIAGAVAGAGTTITIIGVAIIGAVVLSILRTRFGAILIVLLGLIVGAIIGDLAVLAGIGKLTVVIAVLGGVGGIFIAWRVMKGDYRDMWIRSFAIAIAATKGTTFQNADVTRANFSKARFKSTDFRSANLTCTYWHEAKMLNRVRPGETYLKNSRLRQLLISAQGENQNFERQDFRGVNLKAAKFANSSFIDTDFYQANLQEADLSRAILVRANFERADLRNANLTGSCIQDWTITESTKLDGIICDCIYLRWVDGDKRDQMPPRGKFKPGGFVTFVRYILETVELYHEKDINPRLALTVLQKMSRDYDEPLDIVALGKKGEKVFIQVKVSENIIRENLKDDYYDRYDTDLKLWSGDSHKLSPAIDSFIENRISEIASENTDEFVFVDATYVEGNYTEVHKGDVHMTGDRNIEIKKGNYNENIKGDYYEQSGNFGIGHMSGGEIQEGAKVAGVINEAEKQNLADAAQEIQQLLEQLSETYPTTTSREKMTVVGEAVDRIEGNPPLKAKVINALKAGGTEAFKEAINHPLVNILVATFEGWQDTE